MWHRTLTALCSACCMIVMVSTASATSSTTTSSSTATSKPLFHKPISISFASNAITYSLIQSAVQSYSLLRPDVSLTVTRNSDATNRDLMAKNQADIATLGAALDETQQAAQPDTVAFPVFAVGIVPVYNLPNMAVNFKLVLSPVTLANIWTGNITSWNDTQIQMDNLNVKLPNVNITVITRNQSSPDSMAFTQAMGRVSTTFASLMPPSYTPTFPTANYASTVIGDAGNSDGFYAAVASTLTTPFGITYSSYSAASELSAQIALMRNAARSVVECTSSSLTISATEMGIGTELNTWADCSGAQSISAWPICSYAYIALSQVGVGSTCEAKAETVAFVNYLQSNAAVAALATRVAILSAQVRAALPVPIIYCNGKSLSTVTSSVAIFAGNALLENFLSNTLKFYGNYDATRSYAYQRADMSDSMQQVLNGEIDVAIISPDVMRASSPSDWYQLVNSGDIRIMPAFIQPLAPIFHLPDDVVALQSPNFTYPDVYDGGRGIQMRMSVFSKIMTGVISKWNDPSILSLNAPLKERYAYAAANNITMNTQITLVLCCSGTNADTTLTSQFFYAAYLSIRRSIAAGVNLDDSWFRATPFSWNTTTLSLLTKRKAKYQMAALENQLDVTVSQISGSISYHISTSSVPLPQLEFAWNQPVDVKNLSGPYKLIYPVADAALVNVYNKDMELPLDFNDYTIELNGVAASTYYWPFTTLLSFVTLSRYEIDRSDVVAANATLNLVNWLLFSPTLDTAVNAWGLVKMSDDAIVGNRTLHALNYVTCGGTNCLITLPDVWTLSSPIEAFGLAGSIIGLLLCALTATSLVMFRHRTVYRSASIAFLALILLGLAFLFLSAIPIVQTAPSTASCSSFAWLANLGLLFTFAPLFLKMYRIYKIFNRKQLKVVKLSNLKLLSYLAVVVVGELIIMAVWQGIGPLEPITTHIWQGVLDHQYTQCNVPSQGRAYLIVLGVVKACMLLFGTAMSFSTRKVSSTFNESSSVGWSIYNAIFASVVIIAIVTFVGANGDTLVLMELFLVFWIAYSTWAFIFGTKLFTIAQGEKAEQVSALESQRTYTGGFSFVSLDALSKATIDQYLAALEQHYNAVKRKKAVLGNADDRESRIATATTSVYADATHTTQTQRSSVVRDVGSSSKKYQAAASPSQGYSALKRGSVTTASISFGGASPSQAGSTRYLPSAAPTLPHARSASLVAPRPVRKSSMDDSSKPKPVTSITPPASSTLPHTPYALDSMVMPASSTSHNALLPEMTPFVSRAVSAANDTDSISEPTKPLLSHHISG